MRMRMRRWTLVTRRRDGAFRVRRYMFHGLADRAYRSAGSQTYFGDNPIIEVWLFDSRERTSA